MPTEHDLRRALADLGRQGSQQTLEMTVELARAEVSTRRQRHRRKITALLALVVASIVAAFATPVGPAVAEGVSRAADFAADVAGLEPAPPPGHGKEADYAIDGQPSDRQVTLCQRNLGAFGDPNLCRLIIGVSEGRLPPGEYSEEQLDQALGR